MGQHRLVKRLLTGIFNERTPMPRYNRTWDVDTVLTYIKAQGENVDLSDKALTHKLAMLLALTTASRASEVQSLNIDFMIDTGNRIEFSIPTLTKMRQVGSKPLVVTLYQYEEDSKLDVTECVRTYLTRTKSWRTDPSQKNLLLGITLPHKPVCTSTVSGWLKQVMGAAGIDVQHFKGHSTRSASTSKAKVGGLSVKDILHTANWKKASTFQKFYNRSDERNVFSAAVLKQS